MSNPPESLDLDSPVSQFVVGLMEIFYGDELAGEPGSGPTDASVLKARVDELIAGIVGEPPALAGKSSEETGAEAAAAAWEAAEAGDPRAPELALLALRYWPACADAYVLLGLSAGEQAELALPLFTLGVVAGAQAIGPEAFETAEAEGFWDEPEARSFMAALGFLARTNREIGALDAAAVHFAEMLRLNPNDDQGARYELMAIALAMGDMEAATNLFRVYAEDNGAVFAYARALFAYRHGGDTDRARVTLREARLVNPHVPAFILGARPIPDDLDELETPGSESEGAFCAELVRPAWESTPGAIEWLRLQTSGITTAAPPSKEKRSGPRQV